MIFVGSKIKCQRYSSPLLLAIILLGCVVHNLYILLQYDFPLGVDGYYYVVQIDHFLAHKVFYYPTFTPVVLLLSSGIAGLGVGSALALKIFSSLLYAGLATAVFLSIKELNKSPWLGIVGMIVVVLSDLRQVWIFEFVNNLGGITFLMIGSLFFQKRIRRKLDVLLGSSFLILAVFSHKSILPLLCVFVTTYGLFGGFSRIAGSSIARGLVVLFSIAGLVSVLYLTIHFFELPPGVAENVIAEPHFPLFIRGFFAEKFCLLVLSPIAFVVSLRKVGCVEVETIARVNGAMSLLSMLIALNPFLNHTSEILTIPDRLTLLIHIQLAFLLTLTIRLVISDLSTQLIVVGSVVVILLSGIPNSMKGTNRQLQLQRKSTINGLANHKSTIPADGVVVAPHGFQFLITSILGVSSQRLEPNDGARTYWLIFAIPCTKVDARTIVSTDGNNCTVIIRNGDVQPISGPERDRILRANPHLRDIRSDTKEDLLPISEAPN